MDEYYISKWSGLKTRITLSYVWVTVVLMFVLEALIGIIFIFVVPSSLIQTRFPRMYLLKPMFGSVLLLLLITVPIGIFFGMLTTRSIVDRLRSLVTATTHFANGSYTQRVNVTRRDEIGQLEQQFNRMAEQLAETTAQRQVLIEQNARLAERTRISRDLHDSVKQQMFAVSMQIGAALSVLEYDRTGAHKHLVEADLLTYQAQQELTALIQELRSTSLQDKGLIVTLQEYVETWSRQNAIKVDLRIQPVGTLPFRIEEAILRVTQEALSNIARHSGATNIHLQLECSLKQVALSIMDDGHGFDTDCEPQGIGLQSMKERIGALHGKVLIQSEIGQGTHVIVYCPLLPGVVLTQMEIVK